jgi:hypothetical protein
MCAKVDNVFLIVKKTFIIFYENCSKRLRGYFICTSGLGIKFRKELNFNWYFLLSSL